MKVVKNITAIYKQNNTVEFYFNNFKSENADRAWEKQNQARYWELIQSDPLAWSVIDDLSSAANAFHWQGVILGLSVFFSMIKAIKIWDGEKYLEVMKGTYFRASGDFKQHLLLMLCVFAAFVQAPGFALLCWPSFMSIKRLLIFLGSQSENAIC